MSPQIRDLVIECTRRCNMDCLHCLRGDPENIDMNEKYIRKLFSMIGGIGSLTMSGGEPSLVPHIHTKIIEIAKEELDDISSYFMVTNGMQVSNEFIRALFEWHMYCENDDEMNTVEISRDTMHDYIDPDNIKKLKAFRFVEERSIDSDYGQGEYLVNEGRSIDNYPTTRNQTPESIEIEEYGDVKTIETLLYLDCHGNLQTNCDISYDTMDEGKFSLGNIMDKEFDLIKAIETYNLKLEGCLV